MKKQPTFERLRIKLLDELGIDSGDYKRMYAGKLEKGAGAYLWTARRVFDGQLSSVAFGSCHTATELVNTKNKLVIIKSDFIGDYFNWEIAITNEPK